MTTSIVIMGATGDLSKRKLMPALFNLHCKGRLPDGASIVGFARTPYSDPQFCDAMWEGARELGQLGAQREEWQEFSRNLHYVAGSVDSPEGIAALRARVEDLEGDRRPANRLFYLSIAPTLYPGAVEALGSSGMAVEGSGWRRVVIEKPFGTDLSSAQALNKLVHQVFNEAQVFRIDHYLGKETVQNLLVMRFANAIFEPLWNRNYVDSLQITVAETVDVADRAGYYDQSGVVRDMVQNHVLQLLAMVAMEPPNASDPESLRDRKVEVLKAIRRWGPASLAEGPVLGQYRGYLQERGVPQESRTPTYAGLRLHVDNWRWQGVPFYLRTGKAMQEKVSEITIQFKHPPKVAFPLGECQDLSPNVLALCLQPDEGVHLKFQAKVPGQGMCVQPVNMEFHYESAFGDQAIPEAYERLLQDALEGDPSLFIRSDHIEEAWRLVDPLLDPSASLLHGYEPGSWGPAAASQLPARDGNTWLHGCGAHGRQDG